MTDVDSHEWLEDVLGEKALDWVRTRNAKTLSKLKTDPRFTAVENVIRRNALAKDRIPYGTLRKGFVYNFWQDAKHVQGIWRRIEEENYGKPDSVWYTLLDVDELSRKEGKTWVFQGAATLPNLGTRALVTLSDGGKDAATVREFDFAIGQFLEDGFALPEAKSQVGWIDLDTLFLGTNFGDGSLTSSGYPNQVRVWKRGTPWQSAKIVYEGNKDDVSSSGYQLQNSDCSIQIIQRGYSFFESEKFVLKENGTLEKITLPDDCEIVALFKDRLIVSLRKSWKTDETEFLSGSILALKVSVNFEKPELIRAPDEKSSIQDVSAGKDYLFVSELNNVSTKIFAYNIESTSWTCSDISIPELGSADIFGADAFETSVFIKYQSFLIPPTLLRLEAADKNGSPQKFSLTTVMKQPSRFDESLFKSEQFEAKSTDGTIIPYFIIHGKNYTLDSANPTLLYGYGGFDISLTPSYLSSYGEPWLGNQGVYVIANIRGGGEFGPRWHEAALKAKRQKAFDDFIAVAEDLIRRKVTSPKHLGIMGGSNGGLLVGAVFVQRPELFNAVICQVPLLDMMRFHKLLAGASWRGEYGDPDVAEEATYLSKYSPYQNLSSDKIYPKVFFITSTKDDRVHPGHARKMAARMEEFGKPYEYYENIEGGHGAAANLDESVKRTSLEIIYLMQQLMG